MSRSTKDELTETKAYLEGVLHAKVVTEQMGYCKKCGKWDDLRMGVCFDCAVPACPRPKCPFLRLVFCGQRQGKKRIWTDYTYKGLSGKVYCDRDEGVCSDEEYAIAMDKKEVSEE